MSLRTPSALQSQSRTAQVHYSDCENRRRELQTTLAEVQQREANSHIHLNDKGQVRARSRPSLFACTAIRSR